MKWGRSIETLLAKYADEAQVRESLHRRAYYYFKRTLTCFQLPIIILSAISGSLQFISKSFPEHEAVIINCTGGLSIFVTIITSVMTYLKLGESKTKHEISQIAWQNFHNTIMHELNLARDLRQDPAEFTKEMKIIYDRLFEISPICDRKFILEIRRRVAKHATQNFQIPNYLNGFKHAQAFVGSDDDDFENNTEPSNTIINENAEISVSELFSRDLESVLHQHPAAIQNLQRDPDRDLERVATNQVMVDVGSARKEV